MKKRQRHTAARIALALGTLIGGTGLATLLFGLRRRPLDVAPGFELARYMGTWYEIGRLPLRFERGCRDTTASYSLRGDGSVRVVNRCRKGRRLSEAKGRAWPRDADQPARLTVQFRWPFRGDYQILWFDPGYQYAVVGTRNRRHAWILAREPSVDERTWELCCAILREQGFDVRRMIRTEHGRTRSPTRGALDRRPAHRGIADPQPP